MDAGALDRLELRDLAERYAFAADRRDGKALAATFTEDGVLEAPRGRFTGHDELADVAPMMERLYRKTFHAVLGQQAEIDGDDASGETYSIARHYFTGDDGEPRCFEMTIRYQDRFRRTPGGWRFAARRLVVDATHTYPVRHVADPEQAAGQAGGTDERQIDPGT